jgi:hypothetical protein
MSKNSVPAGMPISARSSSRCRASRSPSLMRNDPSNCGSLISPFQPSVVRGFSKYTRMTMRSSSENSGIAAFSSPAYSRAALVS